MKIKHNKKRNTAFVYEAIVKEITVAIIKNDHERKNKAVSILKKHFKPGSVLSKHLECYRSLYETKNVDEKTSEKIIKEARIASRLLDAHGLFVSQSDLIDDVNKELSPTVFNNFVPNYKTLATIYQMFSDDSSPKKSVVLESQLVSAMTSNHSNNTLEPIDNLAMASFVTKFNEKYSGALLENQRTLLNLYITSFSDNSLSLKSFLNEEISNLKNLIKENYSAEFFENDNEMKQKAEKVVELLESFSSRNIDEEVLIKILKTQELAQEIVDNGSNN